MSDNPETSGSFHAEYEAELTRSSADELNIRRRRRGRGFSYIDRRGNPIRAKAALERIAKLAIPPAYEEVRISSDPTSHLQAVGRDAAGRWQHRYHESWTDIREAKKFGRLAQLVDALPRIRQAVRRDMASARLDRRKALACAVAILDETHIRVGCEAYVRTSGARGAATLLKHQTVLARDQVRLSFRGKGGARFRCIVADSRLARALGRLSELPGRRLLQYRDDDGAVGTIQAPDINAYLKDISRAPITAKDLRMLAANALAAQQFAEMEPEASDAKRRRQIVFVMRTVAEKLGNTPAVTRKSYVHARVVQAFEDGSLAKLLRRSRSAGQRKRSESLVRKLIRG